LCFLLGTKWKYVLDLNQLSMQGGVDVIRDNVLHIESQVTLRHALNLIKM